MAMEPSSKDPASVWSHDFPLEAVKLPWECMLYHI
jgi:hypothetical protein